MRCRIICGYLSSRSKMRSNEDVRVEDSETLRRECGPLLGSRAVHGRRRRAIDDVSGRGRCTRSRLVRCSTRHGGHPGVGRGVREPPAPRATGAVPVLPGPGGGPGGGCGGACELPTGLFPQYRELGVFLVRGVDPAGIGLMWRGAGHGGFGFVERAVRPDVHPHRYARSSRRRCGDGFESAQRRSPAVAFIGDGATSEGDVHEALNLAAVGRPRASSMCRTTAGPSRSALRADASAVNRPQGDRLRHAGGPGGRQRRGGLLCGSGEGRRTGPRRRRSDAHRSSHLSDEAPHHLRRPYALPNRRRSSGVDGARSHRRCRATSRARGCGTTASRRRPAKGRRAANPLARRGFRCARSVAVELFDHVFTEPTAELRAQQQQLADELGQEAKWQ